MKSQSTFQNLAPGEFFLMPQISIPLHDPVLPEAQSSLLVPIHPPLPLLVTFP